MFFILASISMTCGIWAQPTDGAEQPRILNAPELREKPWFYSIESAMANPMEVYKLSLSDQKIKTVPEELFQLKNLQVLNLNGCKLKVLPETLGDLANLEMLSLFDNKLRTLPVNIRKLRHLEVLYLGGNKLTEIPVWIGGMGKLRILDISRNPITPLELMQIGRLMPKLQLTY
jgi:Leucine-rich repeat (LRR) protein